ncbi:MAG: MTH1187 family thiamine-binding protein [Syntrophobacterales bacterium]|nr:MTH1187 family thiamine-binding protein [Syntrophobacterales bacterium]
MSVMLEFAMFPTDKGESVSKYVGRIIKAIDESGVSYKLTPMGTIAEVETIAEALAIIDSSYSELEPDCARVYSSIKLDIRKGKDGRLQQKIESVEKKIGKKVKQ